MRIAAGEYGYDSFYFRRMLEAERSMCCRRTPPAAQVLPAFSPPAILRAPFPLLFPLTPRLPCTRTPHAPFPSAINVEYFFDHYRIEQMFFDGALVPSDGMLRPDSSRPGFGLECKLPDMEKYKVYGNAAA